MKLLKFIVLMLIAYAAFKAPELLLGKPIPRSLISIYLFFTAVVALLVATSTEKGARELSAPLRRLADDPALRSLRNAVIIIVPIVGALIAYHYVKPVPSAPALVRTPHPAPPASFTAYEKRIETGSLVNPFRALEGSDRAGFELAAREGGDIYFKNCFFCHGAKLDGAGHYARALKPAPQPFKGSDTIAQLSEGYLFWRIATGAPGLPEEAAPRHSSMPPWEDKLTEDEIWKVITFLYDYTGNRPRRWK